MPSGIVYLALHPSLYRVCITFVLKVCAVPHQEWLACHQDVMCCASCNLSCLPAGKPHKSLLPAVQVLACSIAALGALVFFTFHLQLLLVSKAFGTGFMGRSFTWALLIVETLLPSYLFLQPIIRAMR